MSSKRRLAFYVDGFNLYFGLRASGHRRHFWLNIKALAASLLKSDQKLVSVKYFTSRVSGGRSKRARQNTFLEALGTLDGVKIFYGMYQKNPRFCPKCGTKDQVHSEKMTDVNIAVEMMSDAYDDVFDVAMIVSADSDLVPPIRAVKKLFPEKDVVLAFPPERRSKALIKVAGGYFPIGRANLNASMFPDVVVRKDGFKLVRPESWA